VLRRLQRFASEIGFAALPALAAAALHLAIVTWRREVLNTSYGAWNTRDIAWMVPAGYLLVFAVCALPLAVVASVRRRGLSQRARVWFWSTITVFAVLLLFTRVHSAAWLVVALSVGYQVSAWATRHAAAWGRARRLSSIALGVGFVVFAGSTLVRRAWHERKMLTALPDASASAPNVLLIIWDTARAQNMSLYGYGRPTTPFLDSLARHAVVFDHAYSTAPWTLPSHASMLTGQYPATLSANWRRRLDCLI
jgi:glucan phosphoethanolaminetransferase (alkaline phosphatase superfamily)